MPGEPSVFPVKRHKSLHPLKRHKSLHPLSEHHHHVLVQALLIRRARQAPAGRRAAALRRAARDYVQFWERTGSKHFREEEEVLLPAYARHVRLDRDRAVMRMLADHAAIRARIEQLRAALAARQSVEADVVELGQMLHNHVRLEENEIFPCVEATLSAAELEALGKRLTWLHRRQ